MLFCFVSVRFEPVQMLTHPQCAQGLTREGWSHDEVEIYSNMLIAKQHFK